MVNELIDPTQKRVDKVMVASIGTAFTCFVVVAVAVVVTYGNAVNSDVLQSYPGKFHIYIFLFLFLFLFY